MGSILQASCPCGFETDEILEGQGMDAFSTDPKDFYFLAPAACLRCRTVTSENYFLSWQPGQPVCKKCGEPVHFFNEPGQNDRPPGPPPPRPPPPPPPELEAEPPGFEYHCYTPESGCRCPACGELTLSFIETGLFD